MSKHKPDCLCPNCEDARTWELADALLRRVDLHEALEIQLVEESERQVNEVVLFQVGPFKGVPSQALQLAKWAVEKKAN